MDPASTAGSMAQVLQLRATQQPDAAAFCFLMDGVEEGPRYSYGDLDRQARTVAAALSGVAGPGERALLLYPPGLDFIAAFFGCLYAGVMAVPVYPPRLDRRHASWRTLAGIAADCEPRVVLSSSELAPLLGQGSGIAALESAPWLMTDRLAPGGGSWREPPHEPEMPALLQYTSGSTRAPRGVIVSHSNLMHNERVIQAAFEHSGEGTGVSWLPPYHDMGLIGGILQVVYHGARCMLMSPLVLLQRPERWLQALARYRADTSGGPNFAYDLCVERVAPELRRTLDLSHWSVAAVGSEPVSAATMERFAEAFAPSGFRREAFYPCYGLAEATLLVTGGAKGTPPLLRTHAGSTRVGCGHTRLGTEVRIVDPESLTPCADGRVGEVWVAGPSVAQGYWNRPEESAQTFRARLRQPDATRHYLRSGDLGFVEGGELFITGRLKDVIVIRGRNHYPQDIEATVQAVDGRLRAGCGAVFEAERGGATTLVCVQELERRCRDVDEARLAGDIRQAIAERHELELRDVCFLEAGSIPKTSSGKVQRHRCRADYEQGTLRRWQGSAS